MFPRAEPASVAVPPLSARRRRRPLVDRFEPAPPERSRSRSIPFGRQVSGTGHGPSC